VKSEFILQILLVRAAEETDPRGELVPWTEREQATRQAIALAGEPESAAENAPLDSGLWRFLSVRAGLLQNRALAVVGPVPAIRDLKWPGIGLCAAAFVIGWASHGAGLSRSFDLLAGPFLLVLVWNTVVYTLLAAERFCQPGETSKRGMVATLADGLQSVTGGTHPANKPAEAYARAVAAWTRSWCAPAVVSWFHAGSGCFTLGLLAAIYFRGLFTGYLAGWESTWLDARGVGAFLEILLGSASWITGIPLPDSNEAWELLRRTASREGVPAGPWIHLYAVTLCGWIILPRMILALVSGIHSARKRATPPPWTRKDPYLRRTLALAKQGANLGIAVLPFGFKNTATITAGPCHDAVERVVREAWGQNARACWMPCAAYGDEDAIWDGLWSPAADCGGALLVFDAHATPENEVHGALLDSVWARFSNEPAGLLVALECAMFDARRLDARISAWSQLAQSRKFPLLLLQGGATPDASLSPPDFLRRIE
jgi:hypothetical protein